MISFFYEQENRGPGKVVENLRKGLAQLKLDFEENPSVIKEGNEVLCLQYNKILETSDLKNFVIGPNICNLPFDNSIVMQQNYKKIITPCKWVFDLYSRWLNAEKIVMWPVGIDTNLFSDKSNIKKNIDCLIYYKRRSSEELNFAINLLNKHNQSYVIVEYGNYKELDFLKSMANCKYSFVLDGTESQGIAIEEIMSCNLPLFVWDVEFWADRGESFKIEATSVPYWSEICGIKEVKKENIEDKFVFFLKNIENYHPRNYILEELNLKKQASEIYQILKSI